MTELAEGVLHDPGERENAPFSGSATRFGVPEARGARLCRGG